MWLIFEPPEEKRILGIKVHGLFLRRQDEAAEVYARIIADDVITLERIGDFLLDGPRGDRTRQMLATALEPAIDKAAGPARAAVRVAMGSSRFDAIRDSVAAGGASAARSRRSRTRSSARSQAEKIRALVAARTKELPPRDFVEMMRVGDQGGRVDALRPWRDHGPRRWLPALVDLRGAGRMMTLMRNARTPPRPSASRLPEIGCSPRWTRCPAWPGWPARRLCTPPSGA